MDYADLHLHTHFSDGTFTPDELVRQAARQRLRAIALTDHDTVEGCAPTGEACAREGIEFIAGTELTSEKGDKELHILGYFLDTQNRPLLEAMARFQAVRQQRIRDMVARLNDLGLPLSVEAVAKLASCRSPGRPHVARALVAAEMCSSIDEAFGRYLKKDKPAWVPKMKVSTAEAIRLIRGAGGVAVLAHPGLTRADEYLPVLVEEGLEGLECFHTKHTPSMAERYVGMAKELGLLVTGGSDCHGLSKGKPLIGTVKLPYEHVERLRERALQRAADQGPQLASNGSDQKA